MIEEGDNPHNLVPVHDGCAGGLEREGREVGSDQGFVSNRVSERVQDTEEDDASGSDQGGEDREEREQFQGFGNVGVFAFVVVFLDRFFRCGCAIWEDAIGAFGWILSEARLVAQDMYCRY